LRAAARQEVSAHMYHKSSAQYGFDERNEETDVYNLQRNLLYESGLRI